MVTFSCLKITLLKLLSSYLKLIFTRNKYRREKWLSAVFLDFMIKVCTILYEKSFPIIAGKYEIIA